MGTPKVVVLGGGAAGLFAAISAAEAGASVVLAEKNPFCGKKLNITGKGRCNMTNACDLDTFLANVPVHPRFLYRALTDFSPADTRSLRRTAYRPRRSAGGGCSRSAIPRGT